MGIHKSFHCLHADLLLSYLPPNLDNGLWDSGYLSIGIEMLQCPSQEIDLTPVKHDENVVAKAVKSWSSYKIKELNSKPEGELSTRRIYAHELISLPFPSCQS